MRQEQYGSVDCRRRRINPLIPIGCVCILLFLIIATVVLALIPIYLTARNMNRANIRTYRLNSMLVRPLDVSSVQAHRNLRWAWRFKTVYCLSAR